MKASFAVDPDARRAFMLAHDAVIQSWAENRSASEIAP